MAEKKLGTCSYCGKEFSKVALKKHYMNCDKNVERNTVEEKEDYFFISVEDRYMSEYWLYISVSTKATLKDIDKFLRDIWLECCGHLSAFTIEREHYASDSKKMSTKVDRVLFEKLNFIHEYDFGSTTTLKLKVMSEYEDVKRKEKVKLIARNVAPKVTCSNCNEIATDICIECGESLCEKCIEDHGCDEEMLLPVLNSPRTGVCGYYG
ncbi:MAG: hypothetical protein KA277_10220 [Fusobacteriaceae bacterium]|nr:hypothetical protein [Fusobacteriaceae bacterium]